MKVILDSNVVMAGFLWPGVRTQFFDLSNNEHIQCFTSRELLTEVSEVLHRNQHAQHVARTGFTAAQLVANYRRFARLVPSHKFTQQIAAMPTMMRCSPAL